MVPDGVKLGKALRDFLHMKVSVEDVTRMVQNEFADKPRVEEVEHEIQRIKGEYNMADELNAVKKDLVTNLDYNHDGKVDLEDAKVFFKDWGIVIIGILIFSLTDAQNEILAMIATGSFEWAFFLKLIGTATITSFFYLVKKSTDKEKSDLAANLAAAKEKINQLQTDNACMKLDNLLEIKQKDGEMAILTQQMNYALKVKELELKK